MSCQIIDLSLPLGREFIKNRYGDDGLTIPAPPNKRPLHIQFMIATGSLWRPRQVRKSLARRLLSMVRL